MFIFLVSTVLAWNNVLNTELLGSRFLMSVIKNLELIEQLSFAKNKSSESPTSYFK